MTKKYPKFRNKELEKERARTEHDNWLTNRNARIERHGMKTVADLELEVAIRTMTNWQLTMWHRAGRPKDRLVEFAAMVKPA